MERRGYLRVVIRDKKGKILKDTGLVENKMTRAGVAAMNALLGGISPPAAFTYLAAGSGTTAESNTLTALTTELTTNGMGRASATMTRQTTTFANDTLQFVKAWSVSGANTLNEIGAFNATPSGGDMLCRKLTGAFTLANGMTVTATYLVVTTIT